MTRTSRTTRLYVPHDKEEDPAEAYQHGEHREYVGQLCHGDQDRRHRVARPRSAAVASSSAPGDPPPVPAHMHAHTHHDDDDDDDDDDEETVCLSSLSLSLSLSFSSHCSTVSCQPKFVYIYLVCLVASSVAFSRFSGSMIRDALDFERAVVDTTFIDVPWLRSRCRAAVTRHTEGFLRDYHGKRDAAGRRIVFSVIDHSRAVVAQPCRERTEPESNAMWDVVEWDCSFWRDPS